jgi:hypothetical protein
MFPAMLLSNAGCGHRNQSRPSSGSGDICYWPEQQAGLCHAKTDFYFEYAVPDVAILGHVR